MNAVEIIEKKRDDGKLSKEEIGWFIASYVADQIPDYQASALLMAILLRGLDSQETSAWTDAMLHSGEVLQLSAIPAKKIDKHSTGGVGDKISLPLAPMVAACGVAVPMVSGRGLGHTGGTLDKLESIPGFRTALTSQEFETILGRHHLVLAGQSQQLVPADRKLYALRDVTGTVASIPLIASSIMSKKIAEDIDGLVLDVKVGKGAFIPDEASARRLAETMVAIGTNYGVQVVAFLTDMNQPLGRAVGNANEMAEALQVLRGEGPPDVVELTYTLGVSMLELAGVASGNAARQLLEETVISGRAMQCLLSVVRAQGGDPDVLEHPERLPQPPLRTQLPADRAGFVIALDAKAVGVAAVRLGAGRATKEETIDHRVGIQLLAKVGDRVERGGPLAEIGYTDPSRLEAAKVVLSSAWEIADAPPSPSPLVLGTVP